MKYEKPDVVGVALAMSAIQNRQCPKGNGRADSSACQPFGPKTPTAYQADE